MDKDQMFRVTNSFSGGLEKNYIGGVNLHILYPGEK